MTVINASTAFSKELMRALEQDGKKLTQLTGEDHGPEFFDTCPACQGFGSHEQPVPQHDDPPCKHETFSGVCMVCGAGPDEECGWNG